MTAATSRVAVVAPVGSVTKAWSTPSRLRLFLVLGLIGAALLLIAGETTLAGARATLKTIAVDTAPSMMAAQEIKASFADLDANLANYLLVTAPADSEQATQIFEFRRAATTKRLIDASSNITFGDAEKIPIVMMFENLGRYLELVGRARLQHEVYVALITKAPTQEARDRERDGALATYAIATDLLHERILPDADRLDSANGEVMKKAYARQQSTGMMFEVIAAAVGGALFLVLVVTQVFITRRTRRVFSIPLLIATLLTIGFTGYLVARFVTAKKDVYSAKSEAFDSVHLLWKIRAAAYDANGDESRYLLEKDRRSHWKGRFDENVRAMTTAPDFATAAQREASAAPRTKITGFQGYFADELNNVTADFYGEGSAAIAMAKAFAAYYAVDRRIRESEEVRKDHKAAVDLCVGASNDLFETFDSTVLRALNINKHAFDEIVEGADRSLRMAEIVDPFFALAIAVMIWLGIRPRLREYAV